MNVHFLGRSRVSEGSLRSRNSAVCITVMNASQHRDISAGRILGEPQARGLGSAFYKTRTGADWKAERCS